MATSGKTTFPSVLFAASEAAPYVKNGDLGEMVRCLPKELSAAGIAAAVILPLYNIIDKKEWKLKPKFRNKTVSFTSDKKKKSIKFGLYSGTLHGASLPVYFIENRKIIGGGGVPFDAESLTAQKKEAERFQFFGEAVFACLQNNLLGFTPDVVHANDWQTGGLLALIAENRRQKSKKKKQNIPTSPLDKVKTILTIHDVANQGITKESNYLREGIESADLVTTVSAAYAKEIQNKENGFGLHRILKKKNPLGIGGGFDCSLLKSFGSEDEVKLKFQEKYRLKPGLSKPLIGMVSRLNEDKGIHWVLAVAPYLVEVFDLELALVGRGVEAYETSVMKLMQRYPENVFAQIGGEELAHEIYAAADFVLAPSVTEPCGVNQMMAMRYGAIPIARSTGSLGEIIKHGKTGILFEEKNEKAFLNAVEEALLIFSEEGKFKRMKAECVGSVAGWQKTMEQYLKLYQKVLNLS